MAGIFFAKVSLIFDQVIILSVVMKCFWPSCLNYSDLGDLSLNFFDLVINDVDHICLSFNWEVKHFRESFTFTKW